MLFQGCVPSHENELQLHNQIQKGAGPRHLCLAYGNKQKTSNMSETRERTGIQPYMHEPDSDPEQEETTAEETIMRMNQNVLEW